MSVRNRLIEKLEKGLAAARAIPDNDFHASAWGDVADALEGTQSAAETMTTLCEADPEDRKDFWADDSAEALESMADPEPEDEPGADEEVAYDRYGNAYYP
jgi:hypothetical protein